MLVLIAISPPEGDTSMHTEACDVAHARRTGGTGLAANYLWHRPIGGRLTKPSLGRSGLIPHPTRGPAFPRPVLNRPDSIRAGRCVLCFPERAEHL